MELISLSKKSDSAYDVFYENGVKMGEFLMKEDGYYDFWPENKEGYWPSYILRELARLLDKINEPWDNSVNDYFDLHE